MAKNPAIKRELNVDEYAAGVLAADRSILGQALTLVESNREPHRCAASELISRLLPHSGRSLRVAITGAPGTGKSTLIDSLGGEALSAGRRVAVLAVDPSSSLSQGSILGDKTRMERLGREPACFIRPSPSRGAQGGVSPRTREAILVCEAAGFDLVLVETVGVGQSEIAVRSMVDFFMLLLQPGLGDELQGIKRGAMELADLVVANKADGGAARQAEQTRAEYERALHYLAPATPCWTTRAVTASALTGAGIGEIWQCLVQFETQANASCILAARRRQQSLEWLHAMLSERLKATFFGRSAVQALLPVLEAAVVDGRVTPATAADELFAAFLELPQQEKKREV